MPRLGIGWLLSLIICTAIWADDRSLIAPNDGSTATLDNDIPSFKTIITEIFPEPGWIVVEVTYGDDRPAPIGSSLEVQVVEIDSAKVVTKEVKKNWPQGNTLKLTLNARSLPAGDYLIRTAVLAADGIAMTSAAERSVSWPGQSEEFKGVKILNNLVWELLRLEKTTIERTKRITFRSPKRRWVHVSVTADATTGNLDLSLDRYDHLISFVKGEQATKEAMRILPAGEYQLTLDSADGARIENLVIRSIPEILLHEWMGVHGNLGMTNLEFYERYVLKHVNTFIVNIKHPPYLSKLKRWKQHGGRVLANVPAKGVAHGIHYYPPEEIFRYLSSSVGYIHPLSDGAILDEFSGPCVNCPSYAKALQKLKATPEFKNKLLYFYDANIEFNSKEGEERLNAIVETDSVIAWEKYLPTTWDPYLKNPNEETLRTFLKGTYGLVEQARVCRKKNPKAIEHLAICLGIFTAPGGHLLNSTPRINFNVFLDRMFNVVANDPAFWGSYGLMAYHTSYTDEETLRWICKLFRHYGIEGNTRSATNDPYESSHLKNPDFVDSTDPWEITSAEENTIRIDRLSGLGELQTNYGRSTRGDTGLVMKRSVHGPNTITQLVQNLQPGRLYSFRMMTSDYNDLSQREEHTVNIHLHPVTVISERSFTSIFPDASFVDVTTQKTWLNYHRVLFRAKGKTARVTISDWANDNEPVAPIGQELLLNYIQVHPYYPREEE